MTPFRLKGMPKSYAEWLSVFGPNECVRAAAEIALRTVKNWAPEPASYVVLSQPEEKEDDEQRIEA